MDDEIDRSVAIDVSDRYLRAPGELVGESIHGHGSAFGKDRGFAGPRILEVLRFPTLDGREQIEIAVAVPITHRRGQPAIHRLSWALRSVRRRFFGLRIEPVWHRELFASRGEHHGRLEHRLQGRAFIDEQSQTRVISADKIEIAIVLPIN